MVAKTVDSDYRNLPIAAEDVLQWCSYYGEFEYQNYMKVLCTICVLVVMLMMTLCLRAKILTIRSSSNGGNGYVQSSLGTNQEERED